MSFFDWHEPHGGQWSRSFCNITAIVPATSKCADIPTVDHMMHKETRPTVDCCRLNVTYGVRLPFKRGIDSVNALAIQPMSLSKNRFHPADSCYMARGINLYCWYYTAAPYTTVESELYYDALNAALLYSGGYEALAILWPAMHCTSVVCLLMTALSCASSFLVMASLVWGISNPNGYFIEKSHENKWADDNDSESDFDEVHDRIEMTGIEMSPIVKDLF